MQLSRPRKRILQTLLSGFIIGVVCAFVLRDIHPFRRECACVDNDRPGPDASLPTVTVNAVCTPADSLSQKDSAEESKTDLDPRPIIAVDPFDPLEWLNGPPALSYKDNLQKHTKYITSWGSSAGWTNDVISFINLIYLGLITDRVTILPVFMSTHLPGHAPALMFGDVFNISRLRTALEKPVLEWREVKQSDSPILDDIGCWNVWESSQYNDLGPRHSNVPWKLNLDVSYTKTPYWIKMIPNFEHDQHCTFWSLAALAFPAGRKANLVPALPSFQHRLSLPPDDHLLCYDFLYYVAAQEPFEIALDYSPAWRYVGQYMRWTDPLVKLADEYVRRTLGVDATEPIPPFISIHARRDDFQGWCGDFTLDECFAPLEVINRRVQEVKAELFQRKAIMVHHIIITSDEKDKKWWAQVARYGWVSPDHRQTEERYGIWYPVLIDAVIQSQGIGFVGTDRSTMSILAARRVESWRDGAVRFVLWGRPGADDH
ncbi:hypothetical protein DFH07DRAFT_850334 [Mycena maculata]|uniref:Uncharacterized protein n=1 Tax=Mycena maculata TaxID=230809 RepID=A0AAD7HWA3_9AGAR|nr:hypothetical protein DFH07DRAFT_850334 [Mycena maculata]